LEDQTTAVLPILYKKGNYDSFLRFETKAIEGYFEEIYMALSTLKQL
jgi:hypothetical protein